MLKSIIEQLKLVKDFRNNRGRRHELWVGLAIIILALLTDHVTYQDIASFKQKQKNKLIEVLQISREQLPSYSTLRRIMIGVDQEELQLIFQSVVDKYYLEKDSLEWIAIDGKALKNTMTNYENKKQNMLVMVSAYSPETNLVIRANTFESKNSSESAEVRTMIEKCGLVNKVFTLDALHCSQKTTRTIIDSKNDYLITVKGNQSSLYNQLKAIAKTDIPLTVFREEDVSHGRYVNRKVSVFDSKNIRHKNYPHIQSFIEVERTGRRNGQEYKETLYYICSRKFEAEIVGKKIREHWFIENKLHWVKDVIFHEDSSRIRGKEVAGKLSLLVTIILNLYRSLGFDSIKKGQLWLGYNWEKLLAIA
jgi:predicted transposase YbfD/YdcC